MPLRDTHVHDLRIDARRGIAYAGARVPLRNVVEAAAAANLVPLLSAGPEPGVPARIAGLSARGVRAITCDGGTRLVDAATEPQVFWAGLTAGDVAAYELTLVPALTAGALMWPWEHAHRVLHEWRAWTRSAAVVSVARLVRTPHLPGAAPELRGRAFASIEVGLTGDAVSVAARLAGLRRLEPEIDTVDRVAPAALRTRSRGVPDRVLARPMLLDELPAAALDALLAAAAPGLVSVDVHDLGDRFVVVGLGGSSDADEGARTLIALDGLARRLAPWTSGAVSAERRAA